VGGLTIYTDATGRRFESSPKGWRPIDDVIEQAESRFESNGEGLPTPPESRATVPPPPKLAREQDILARFGESVGGSVVGETRLAKLVFLTIVTRLFDRPTSLAVKGLSSGGKSYTVEATVDHFAEESTHRLTGMSEHFLIYDDHPVAHTTLLLYEYVALKTGMKDDQTSYFIRSLLSEGVLRHGTVEKTKDGLKSRIIEKPGPTNLIVTTTEVSLHAENETRCLSVTVDDSNEQTKRVLLRIAEDREELPDLGEWHKLDRWLATQDNRVVVPYATRLAELVPPVAVRLRRDFGAILALIKAHALLHRLHRDHDEAGRVVANLDDYAVVRDIVADIVAEGLGATVSAAMRETVENVEKLAGTDGVTAADLGRALELDKSAARRRLRAAGHRGYVKNLEERRGRPGRYVTDDPLPDQVDVLPPPDHLTEDKSPGKASGGTVASRSGGVKEPCVRCDRYGSDHQGDHLSDWGRA
jgi:hypothetical protein